MFLISLNYKDSTLMSSCKTGEIKFTVFYIYSRTALLYRINLILISGNYIFVLYYPDKMGTVAKDLLNTCGFRFICLQYV